MSLGADRKVSLYNNAGNIDLIADLSGFYTADYGYLILPRDPRRVLDTRTAPAAQPARSGPRVRSSFAPTWPCRRPASC